MCVKNFGEKFMENFSSRVYFFDSKVKLFKNLFKKLFPKFITNQSDKEKKEFGELKKILHK